MSTHYITNQALAPGPVPLLAAKTWIARGCFPIPIPYQSKKPVRDDWPALRITAENAHEYFNGTQQNIGVLLGEPYGLGDVDLDCMEAVSIAPKYLPATRLKFGRASKPASHWLYRLDPPVPSKKYKDPLAPLDKSTIIELRCLKQDGDVGFQTVVPPSIHDKSGEQIRFEAGCDGEPANIEAQEIQDAVATIAAASVLARYWPKAGRHDCELALSGVLARARWNVEDAVKFVLATYTAVPTHDRSALGRVENSVRDTFRKFSADQEVTGIPSLIEHVGESIAKTFLKWLPNSEQDQAVTEPFLSDPPPVYFDVYESVREQQDDRRIHRVEELESVFTKRAPVAYLVEPELPERNVIGLVGDSESGKTTLACAWARDVIVEGHAVLILDRDQNPRERICDRLERLGIDTDGELLRIWDCEQLEEAPQPNSPIIVDWVIRMKAETGRSPLVILDSLVSFLRRDEDENSSKDMRALVDRSRLLTRAGGTVLWIHHTGKDGCSATIRSPG